ncbi:MAG TPA: major capsid protein, partial [Candidatus Hydrogenedentes bacterium]|nr:major capsid protein [Candidatus Hydrogenedentota bacterium]
MAFETRPLAKNRFAEPADLHVDAALSHISLDFRNDEFIADRVSPRIRVEKESDKYFVWGTDAFQTPSTARAPKGYFARTEFAPSTASFVCEEYGLEVPVDDRERRNADAGADIEIAAVEKATGIIMTCREKRLADILTSTSRVTQNTTLSGTSQWNDYTNSTPIANIDTARSTIHAAGAPNPNTLVMGREVFDTLKRHPDILEAFKYTRSGAVTEAMMADLLGVERVLVGNARYRTSNEGQASALAYVWGKNAVLLYTPSIPSRFTPAATYTFVFTDRVVETYREPEKACTVVRVREETAEVVASTACCYL